MRGFESTHHLLFPRKGYRHHHDKKLRNQLTVGTDWEPHRELHAHVQPPAHPDIGIVLHLIDRIDEKQPAKPDLPLYTVDWLIKLGSAEALQLSDHLVLQLGYLGVGDGRVR